MQCALWHDATSVATEPPSRFRLLRFLLGGGKAKAATPPPPAKPGPVVDVGDMTINLADQSPRYAAVSMSLELTATGSSDEVTKGIPILKDAALKKLSAHIKRRKLEFHAISAVTGQGIDELKWALAKRMRAVSDEIPAPTG